MTKEEESSAKEKRKSLKRYIKRFESFIVSMERIIDLIEGSTLDQSDKKSLALILSNFYKIRDELTEEYKKTVKQEKEKRRDELININSINKNNNIKKY